MQFEFQWEWNFDIIIPIGTVFPLRKGFLLKYSKNIKLLKGII